MMANHRNLVLWFLLLALCPFAGRGQTSAESSKRQLNQLQSQIKQVDAEVNSLQLEKNRLHEQLKEQEIRYGQIARIVKDLQIEIDRQRDVLKEIGRKIEVARNAVVRQKNELERQIRSAHAMGGKERLKVIFNQQDPELSSRMLVYYDYLNKARLDKLKIVEENFRTLTQLENKKQQEAVALTDTLGKYRHEQNELQAVRKEREKLLVQLNNQYSSKKTQLEQLKINERRLQQLIASLQKSADGFPFQEGPAKPFAQLKGQLPWPLAGRLIKKFGSSRAESRWDGVLINAAEGSNIHAVTRGRVVYADWLRGYGLLTIIDHGNGYMTLYAFNQSLYKTEGEWVEAGDVIASVGKSGGRSKPALYFGIRKKGKPVDPVTWCRKMRKDRVG